MIFVFDSSPLSALFKNFYRSIFGRLWDDFDTLVEEGRLVSTREVLREIEDGPVEGLREWAKGNKEIFASPTAEQGAFVAEIYKVTHFQQNIETKKFFKGGRNADPFVIARAAVEDATVVTLEKMTPNAAKIPNICRHFGVDCMNLEEFMAAEDWRF